MGNPYRDHADVIQAEIKKLSREYLNVTPLQKDYANSPGYLRNFVSVSGGQPFDHDMETMLKDVMKKVTEDDIPDPA